MGTYLELQTRIADEIMGRTDISSAASGLSTTRVQYAIQDAIKFWEPTRFWFNEYRTASAFNTVAHQEFYTSADWADIATIAHIDKLSVLISGNRYFMEPRTAQYMEDVSINAAVYGQPVDYSYYDEQLRFYPIPDQVYAVNVLGTKTFSALSANADTNVWTTEAEALIRADAKMRLFRDFLLDPSNAAVCAQTAKAEASNLKRMTYRRMAPARVTPTYF
jgi:hypothetical protein